MVATVLQYHSLRPSLCHHYLGRGVDEFTVHPYVILINNSLPTSFVSGVKELDYAPYLYTNLIVVKTLLGKPDPTSLVLSERGSWCYRLLNHCTPTTGPGDWNDLDGFELPFMSSGRGRVVSYLGCSRVAPDPFGNENRIQGTVSVWVSEDRTYSQLRSRYLRIGGR